VLLGTTTRGAPREEGSVYRGEASVKGRRLSGGPSWDSSAGNARYRNWRDGYDQRAVVLVEVERALPLTSPAYDLGATEEEVRGRWERRHEAISQAGSAR
jgi:hypothetical protein